MLQGKQEQIFAERERQLEAARQARARRRAAPRESNCYHQDALAEDRATQKCDPSAAVGPRRKAGRRGASLSRLSHATKAPFSDWPKALNFRSRTVRHLRQDVLLPIDLTPFRLSYFDPTKLNVTLNQYNTGPFFDKQ